MAKRLEFGDGDCGQGWNTQESQPILSQEDLTQWAPDLMAVATPDTDVANAFHAIPWGMDVPGSAASQSSLTSTVPDTFPTSTVTTVPGVGNFQSITNYMHRVPLSAAEVASPAASMM